MPLPGRVAYSTAGSADHAVKSPTVPGASRKDLEEIAYGFVQLTQARVHIVDGPGPMETASACEEMHWDMADHGKKCGVHPMAMRSGLPAGGECGGSSVARHQEAGRRTRGCATRVARR